MSEITEGEVAAYGVELLFEEAPELDKAKLFQAIKAHCPNVELMEPSPDELTLALVHTDHMIELEDGALPAQSLVMAGDRPHEPSEDLTEALEQSWTFEGVKEVVARCKGSMLITDLMAAGLPYPERIALFQRVLAGVLDVVSPLAIHWVPSGQVISPDRFREAYKEGGSSLLFAGTINVRFFNVDGSSTDMIMDTLGLSALGLPDLQCHFHTMDPNEVAALLYNTGNYLFGHGDIIEDGHSLAGISDESRWRCEHKPALAPPARTVLDLDPGPLFSAGERDYGTPS
ncbi:DUF4261 domain-containing protein [Singulisphaera sp. PoT]|uniref:DUF4261 domain-containing protein n=1 Tax=Singulisphaera sp. PoT TaxID=3411797 RepID=UPI003BF5AA21